MAAAGDSPACAAALLELEAAVTMDNRNNVGRAVLRAAPGLAKKCVGILESKAPAARESQTAALKALVNLAAAVEARQTLVETPKLVETVLRVATLTNASAVDASAREAAVGVLANLSAGEEGRLALANTPGLVAMFVAVSAQPNTELRFLAVHGLFALSSTPMVARAIDTPDVVKALVPRLKDEDTRVKQRAAMTLANIVGSDKERSHVLTSDHMILADIVNVLRMALDGNKKGWRLITAMPPISSLSIVAENRAFFASVGVPALLVMALEQSNASRDARTAEAAIAALQQFTFDEQTLLTLKGHSALTKQLQIVLGMSTAEWTQARRAAQYLSKKLAGELDQTVVTADDADPSSSSSKKKHRAMISYAWRDQTFGRRVDEFLTKHGCDVWRDERNMSGNIVDAMMKGVLGSQFVVCVVSRGYYESANCRSELEFARLNGKTIVPVVVEPSFDFRSNWIGFLLGNALYYTVVPEFDSAMEALLAREVERRQKAASGGSSMVAPTSAQGVKEWLAAQSLPVDRLLPALEREGFADALFPKLKGQPASELKALLGISTADAVLLFDALAKVVA